MTAALFCIAFALFLVALGLFKLACATRGSNQAELAGLTNSLKQSSDSLESAVQKNQPK